MPELTKDGEDVFVLDLGDDENRFHPDWMSELSRLLDEVAATPEPRALVIGATGKFFSNGLDLDWLGRHPDRIDDYVAQVHDLFAQVLAFPAPTAAALQGHTFAAGAMLALACDWRVMRADRGFFCLPEADLRIPFTPGMNALITSKLTPATAIDAMTTGRRFGGDEALAAGLVTATAPEGGERESAIGLVRPHAAKHGETLATIKARMFATELAVLRDHAANKFGS